MSNEKKRFEFGRAKKKATITDRDYFILNFQ